MGVGIISCLAMAQQVSYPMLNSPLESFLILPLTDFQSLSMTREDANDETMLIPASDDPETDCVKSTAFFYNDWLMFGKPACWCFPRNCRGDADGKWQGSMSGHTYVFSNDLNVLISAWYIKEPPKGPGIWGDAICADFDRREQGNIIIGFWRVGPGDLNILIKYWQLKEPPRGPGVPDCMDTGHYNFFVNP